MIGIMENVILSNGNVFNYGYMIILNIILFIIFETLFIYFLRKKELMDFSSFLFLNMTIILLTISTSGLIVLILVNCLKNTIIFISGTLMFVLLKILLYKIYEKVYYSEGKK
jgi:hypothetical protein